VGSITTKALAEQHGIADVTLKAYLRELGIRCHGLRDPERRNQACAAVTEDQAEQFRQHREDNGFTGKPIYPWEQSA
jgi:hypothetical protein